MAEIGTETLSKKIGPLPIGGWILLVGGAATAAYMLSRNNSSSTTRTIVDQVPVPVGAIAAPDGAPLVMSPIVHANIPGLEALTDAVTGNTGATTGNTAAVTDNTAAVTGNTAAVAKVIAAPIPVPAKAAWRPAYPGYVQKRGRRGSDVKEIQRRLNAIRSAGLVVDGVFGAKTEAAVRAFQRASGLIVDGIVGPVTWHALWK
jgi:hypothetical protein